MIKHGEPNPLNILDIRRLQHCPPHFETVEFDLRASLKDISDWIYENTDSRFYIGDRYRKIPGSDKTVLNYIAGFENPSEASYFGLMLDSFNISSHTW